MSVILAIESSCDDTSAAIIKNGKVLANVVANQDIHREYGGVVPELASRAHQKNIIPVVDVALQRAGIERQDLSAIGVTSSPGLLGSLLVGLSYAKGLSQALRIPIIGVNHIEAHILSHFIENPHPNFPFLCLLVSGGHTQIYLLRSELDYEVLGKSTDDAAGEALDKGAKILGLNYPGGPEIDKRAKKGNKGFVNFPLPSTRGFDYSFSGLKTSLLYKVKEGLDQDDAYIDTHLNDLCASYQERIITYLLLKLEKAGVKTGIRDIGIAGGVAANSRLRELLNEIAEKHSWNVFIPKMEYCTDNAAMIAKVAEIKYQSGIYDSLELQAKARV